MLPFFVFGFLLFQAQLLEAADPVIVASSDVFPDVRQPRVAVNESGHVFVAFGANEDVFVCQSVDQGETFSTPVHVGHITKLALGMRRVIFFGLPVVAGIYCSLPRPRKFQQLWPTPLPIPTLRPHVPEAARLSPFGNRGKSQIRRSWPLLSLNKSFRHVTQVIF